MARRKQAPRDELKHLVVIGSSAGGIDALGELVATLPADFAAPILVVQHLDPRRVSHLSEILQRRTQLRVRSVSDREPLEDGVVFVIPADRHVAIVDHTVRVLADGREEKDHPRPRPSIDRALTSASEAYGEGVIAVILTGAGSDGAAGARRVKAVGGTVVIQNPETASYPAMPLSLAPTVVDVVADLDAIGPLLRDLIAGTYMPRQPDEETLLHTFLDGLRESIGIDFGQYKRPTILRRLQRRMVATSQRNLREYVRFTHGHPEELQRLANTFLIKVTEFFRDPDLYRYLGERVMPELLQQAHESASELRFWSAGCATGEEAYSLAIVVSEALREFGNDIRVRIFATDVDAEAVEFARRGIYPAAALERLPDDLRSRYFLQHAGHFEIVPTLRRLIAFGQHDLAQRAPFPRIDLTICRNVLIYFTSELQRRALQLFAFSLRDGGYLVLGKSETTSPLSDMFVLEEARLKVFRRRGSRVMLPTSRITVQPVRILQPQSTPQRGPVVRGIADVRVGEVDRARTLSARADRVLMRLPVGVALVDRKYDVAMINTAARNLLGVHGSAIGQDLVHLVQGVPSNELRREVDRAFRGEPSQTVWDIPVATSTSGETTSLEITCYRQGDGTAAVDEHVCVIVRDVTRERSQVNELRSTGEQQTARVEQLSAQIERMAEAARGLREANAELTSVNAELRSQNDELVVSNEEVQAATEEVETLNEEMQATNEELETLNEELQATVEELNTTNDDLEARSMELQNLAISLEHQRELSESERARLEAVLLSMGDAVVVTGPSGEPMLTNETFDRTFGKLGSMRLEDEFGQEMHGDQLPWRRPVGEGTEVLRFSGIDGDGERRWYEASRRGLDQDPSRGMVSVIRDVTASNLQQLQNEFVAMLSHELRTPLTGVTAYLELLERELRERGNGRVHRYAERALSQAQRFASLVSDLFDANRLRSGRMRFAFLEVDLGTVVEEAVAMSRPLAGEQEIIFKPPSRPIPLTADPDRLQQVVLNLVSNAIRHASSSPTIEVAVRRRGRQAEVSVTDHGPGLPSALQDSLWGRGGAAPGAAGDGGEGLGLGLFIARSIVEGHGGTIRVDSREGDGATFTVRIPIEHAGAGAVSHPVD